MKQIIILLVLFAMLQNVNALNIFPGNQNVDGSEKIVVRYPVLRCGVIERPENEEIESSFTNKGSVEGKLINKGRIKNPFSTENSFRCQIVWIEKELPNQER